MSSPRPQFSQKPNALWPALLLSPFVALGAHAALGVEEKVYQPVSAQNQYEKEIRPLLDMYCGGCHGAKKQAGGINLSGFDTAVSIQRDQATWRKVVTQIHESAMPPENKPQPTPEQREKLVHWLQQTLDNFEENAVARDPGRKIIHRLNRLEYNNTVRDLLGVTSNPADKFPADGGGGGGFDNTADTLFIPPILMERYLEAADEILNEAPPERIFGTRPPKKQSPAEARLLIERFAGRAYRRPVEKAEIDRLMKLFENAMQRGARFEEAVKLSLKAVLVSPHFLFRI